MKEINPGPFEGLGFFFRLRCCPDRHVPGQTGGSSKERDGFRKSLSHDSTGDGLPPIRDNSRCCSLNARTDEIVDTV